MQLMYLSCCWSGQDNNLTRCRFSKIINNCINRNPCCIVNTTISMPVNGTIQDMSEKWQMRWYFCFNKNGCVENDCVYFFLLNHLIDSKWIWTDFIRSRCNVTICQPWKKLQHVFHFPSPGFRPDVGVRVVWVHWSVWDLSWRGLWSSRTTRMYYYLFSF